MLSISKMLNVGLRKNLVALLLMALLTTSGCGTKTSVHHSNDPESFAAEVTGSGQQASNTDPGQNDGGGDQIPDNNGGDDDQTGGDTQVNNGGDQGSGGNGANGNVADNGNNGLNGGNGNNGENGQNGNNGANGINGQQGQVGLQGPPGEPGAPGRDGRDYCPSSATQLEGLAKALDPMELETLAKTNGESSENSPGLPYLLTKKGVRNSKGKQIKIDLRTAGETNKTTSGVKHIMDAQVVFDVELSLPARNHIDMNPAEPFRAELRLEVMKRDTDKNHLGTEIICFMDEQVCSGKAFTAKGWDKLINPNFGGGNAIHGDYFSQVIESGLKREKASKTWGNNIAVDLAKLFAPSGSELTREQVLDILYGDAAIDQPVKRQIRLVVADDTFVDVNKTKFFFEYKDTCIQQETKERMFFKGRKR